MRQEFCCWPAREQDGELRRIQFYSIVSLVCCFWRRWSRDCIGTFGRIEILAGRIVLLCIGPGGLAAARSFSSARPLAILCTMEIDAHSRKWSACPSDTVVQFQRTDRAALGVHPHNGSNDGVERRLRDSGPTGFVDAFLLRCPPIMLIASVPISIGGLGCPRKYTVLAFSTPDYRRATA